MKYTKIEEGDHAGYYEDENGVIYTERVALKRMAKPELYDPKPAKEPKKKAKK